MHQKLLIFNVSLLFFPTSLPNVNPLKQRIHPFWIRRFWRRHSSDFFLELSKTPNVFLKWFVPIEFLPSYNISRRHTYKYWLVVYIRCSSSIGMKAESSSSFEAPQAENELFAEASLNEMSSFWNLPNSVLFLTPPLTLTRSSLGQWSIALLKMDITHGVISPPTCTWDVGRVKNLHRVYSF